MNFFTDLVEYLKEQKQPVYIQTHNFPDHDAVASAYGLQYLLSYFNIKSHLIYEGVIQRDSLHEMINRLKIDIRHNKDYPITEQDKIIIVDGCKYNKNVTDLIGDEIAIIDHHQVEKPDDVPFSDIHSEYGSCSTIIQTYFERLNLVIPEPVSTALMIGLNMDTMLLTRGVSETDIDAYAALYKTSDIQLQNSILRNNIQTRDLKYFSSLSENVMIKDAVAYYFFPEGCNQNLLGILGDFLLSLQEIDFVILCARNDGAVNYSLRSERSEWNAASIIQQALNGIGFGGGHHEMAGGIIKDITIFDETDIRDSFFKQLT